MAALAPAGMAIEIGDAPALPLFDGDLEQATQGGPEALRQRARHWRRCCRRSRAGSR
ncbi:MAG: hypothetical protein ABFC67_00790 [Mizugakiibacter sp.]|uniref:hypothetical protein n=1 Tax=Mizugakiibacter sp. TaxID=1972610 RepID=UPI0031BCCA8F|nr:hypothetical protein [Xanthomonadaceae bacterium]